MSYTIAQRRIMDGSRQYIRKSMQFSTLELSTQNTSERKKHDEVWVLVHRVEPNKIKLDPDRNMHMRRY
jgi:hypothetical protein